MQTNKGTKVVILLRGCSGSGKTGFANFLYGLSDFASHTCCADDYFYQGGEYKFDPEKLGEAHRKCKEKFRSLLAAPETSLIVVANTNTKESDFDFYIKTAEEFGVDLLFSLVVENRHGTSNTHGVPQETLLRQQQNIVQSLKLLP